MLDTEVLSLLSNHFSTYSKLHKDNVVIYTTYTERLMAKKMNRGWLTAILTKTQRQLPSQTGRKKHRETDKMAEKNTNNDGKGFTQ